MRDDMKSTPVRTENLCVLSKSVLPPLIKYRKEHPIKDIREKITGRMKLGWVLTHNI
jgi:hypothetical protein